MGARLVLWARRRGGPSPGWVNKVVFPEEAQAYWGFLLPQPQCGSPAPTMTGLSSEVLNAPN